MSKSRPDSRKEDPEKDFFPLKKTFIFVVEGLLSHTHTHTKWGNGELRIRDHKFWYSPHSDPAQSLEVEWHFEKKWQRRMGESINFAESFRAKLRSAPRIPRLYKKFEILITDTLKVIKIENIYTKL